jgi:hypothetical protein
MRKVLTFVLLAACVAAGAAADHPPEWLVSRATPETTLMGISIHDGVTVGALKARFGVPAVDTDPRFPNEAHYTWRRGELQVRVTTMYRTGTPQDQQSVYAVKVASPREDKRAKTSAGLHLGGTLSDLVNQYGYRYQTQWLRNMSTESSTVVVTFENDTRLSAGFSDAGRIISLELVESQE